MAATTSMTTASVPSWQLRSVNQYGQLEGKGTSEADQKTAADSELTVGSWIREGASRSSVPSVSHQRSRSVRDRWPPSSQVQSEPWSESLSEANYSAQSVWAAASSFGAQELTPPPPPPPPPRSSSRKLSNIAVAPQTESPIGDREVGATPTTSNYNVRPKDSEVTVEPAKGDTRSNQMPDCLVESKVGTKHDTLEPSSSSAQKTSACTNLASNDDSLAYGDATADHMQAASGERKRLIMPKEHSGPTRMERKHGKQQWTSSRPRVMKPGSSIASSQPNSRNPSFSTTSAD